MSVPASLIEGTMSFFTQARIVMRLTPKSSAAW